MGLQVFKMTLSTLVSIIIAAIIALFIFKLIKKIVWTVILALIIAALLLYVPDTDLYRNKIRPWFTGFVSSVQ
jgi:undecaprenyl pyrophosphate phosphatase UppP